MESFNYIEYSRQLKTLKNSNLVVYYEVLDKIIDAGHSGLKKISYLEMGNKPAPAKWSKKEILGHLIDSAYNNHLRFIRTENQGNLIFKGYDQVNWVNKNNYQNRQTIEIMETWILVNKHLMHLLKNIPESVVNEQTKEHNFHQICMNLLNEQEVSSLGYLIWDYLFHMEHHLDQIIPGYKRVLGPFNTY